VRELKDVQVPLQNKAKADKKNKVEGAAKTLKQIEILKESVEILKACNEILFTHLVMKRSQDVQDMVRKSVFEFMLQLEQAEI
jgi:hypothetical protein